VTGLEWARENSTVAQKKLRKQQQLSALLALKGIAQTLLFSIKRIDWKFRDFFCRLAVAGKNTYHDFVDWPDTMYQAER